MAWVFRKKWQQIKEKDLFDRTSSIKEVFHLLTTTLLSLLLPLSFLLLARLSSASVRYYRFTLADPSLPPRPLSTALFSIFVSTHPTLLHALVSFISIATFIHGLTGKTTFSFSSPILRPRLYTAWILLSALQICVGLGIEGSIAEGVEGSADNERVLLSKLIFIVGLHETMLHWFRMVVKPVVDDTVFGDVREENWAERAAVMASFGGLWWWRLREEVESLVTVGEASTGGGWVTLEIFGWWLYYLTVTIGTVRILKGLIWVVMVSLCKTCRKAEKVAADACGNDNKV